MRVLSATLVLLTIAFSVSVAISAEETVKASDSFLPPSPVQSAEIALFKLGQVNKAVMNLNSIPAPEACSQSPAQMLRQVPQKTAAVACMLSGGNATHKPEMMTLNVTSFETEIGESFRIKKSTIEVSSGSGTRQLESELESLFGEAIKLDPEFLAAAESKCRGVLQSELKRVMEGDLVNFRCKAIPTGFEGAGSESKRLLEERLATSIGATPPVVGIGANPWIQIDGFQKNLGHTLSPFETETTVRFSSAKKSGSNVKPFIGVTRTEDALDRKNPGNIRSGLKEAQFAVGITMEWK